MHTRTCRSPDCSQTFESDGRAYCDECSREVWAYESCEGEPMFVAEHDPRGSAETEVELGVEYMGEQCDDCGNSRYVVVAGPSGRGRGVRCSDQEIDGQHFEGCGTVYPLQLLPSYEVIF